MSNSLLRWAENTETDNALKSAAQVVVRRLQRTAEAAVPADWSQWAG